MDSDDVKVVQDAQARGCREIWYAFRTFESDPERLRNEIQFILWQVAHWEEGLPEPALNERQRRVQAATELRDAERGGDAPI